MATNIGMFPDIYAITFKIWIHPSGYTRIGTDVWASIRIKTRKSKSSGNLDVQFGEESYSLR